MPRKLTPLPEQEIQNLILEDYEKMESMRYCILKYSINAKMMKRILANNNVKEKTYDDKMRYPSFRKISFDEDYFEKIDTNNKAYVLGLLFADGCLHNKRHNVQLRLSDIDLLEAVRKDLRFEGILYNDKPNGFSKKGTKTLTVCSKKFYTDLINLGLTKRKSYTNSFPVLDEKYYPPFIRGFFDGNGSIYVGKDSRNDRNLAEMVICSSSIFCNQLKLIFDSIKISSNLFKDPKHDERILKIRIRQKESLLDFYRFLYADMNKEDIYLERKYLKFIKYFELIGGEEMSYIRKEITQESRNRMSESQKKLNRTGENSPSFGKHMSEETKEKISKIKTGVLASEETKQKMSESQKQVWAKRKGNIS